MGSVANLMEDESLVDNTAEFITHFLDTRFEGLTGDMRLILADVCMEMFEAGAAWADSVAGREDKTIITLSAQG